MNSAPTLLLIPTKTVLGRLFLCLAEEVTQQGLPAFIDRAKNTLAQALGTASIGVDGVLHVICEAWAGCGLPSRVMAALPVKEAKSVPRPCFLWQAPDFPCAWKQHRGPMTSIATAWNEFSEEVLAQGLKTRDGWREVYLHWESFHSENDVTELQIEIKQAPAP